MSAASPDKGSSLWFVATLTLLWLAASSWLRPLMLPDEGRYVGVAWEMMTSGQWLTPTLDGLPYFHKPPLFYWITAASMAVFGQHEMAARAAPLLGGTLGAVALFGFVRHWLGTREAQACLLVLLVNPLHLVGAQFSNLDMLVAGCISATIVLLAHAVLCAEQGLPYQRTLMVAYAMSALGVLAKGLIGFVLPALVVLAWLGWRRQWLGLWRLWSWAGAVLFLAITGPWFVAMQQRFPDFLDYFFIVQHFKRFAAGGFNNVQPFWFYPLLLLAFSLPWLPWAWWGSRRPEPSATAASASLRSLWWTWLAMITLFFSLPQSKLLGYILPALPPLAALLALGCLRLDWGPVRALRPWWALAALPLLISALAVGWMTARPDKSARNLALSMSALRLPGQPVVALWSYPFDLPFYAALESPMWVVEDWADPDIQARDNWRKELMDAGQFAPDQAAGRLLSLAQLAPRLCAVPVAFVVASVDEPRLPDYLRTTAPLLRSRGKALWRLDMSQAALLKALGCAETPSGG